MITVPACAECNNSSKLDDEYFRWFVATLGEQTPASDVLIQESVLPRFRERPALLHSIMQKSRIIDVYSPRGVWLGKRPAFEFDRPRIQNTVEKIVKGLYRHEYGERLVDAKVEEFALNPDGLTEEEKAQIIAMPPHIVHPDVFVYRCARDEQVPCHSVWFLMFFFPKTLFFTVTTPTWAESDT